MDWRAEIFLSTPGAFDYQLTYVDEEGDNVNCPMGHFQVSPKLLVASKVIQF